MIPIIIQYSGFVVQFCSVKDEWRKSWNPEKGDYDKNYFATYFYSGSIDEYNLNGDLVKRYENEHAITESIVLDFATNEIYKKTIWMCFSSWKPLSATYLRLTEPTKIPAGLGVYNALGNFEFTENDTRIKSRILNYVKPRTHEITIEGNAKILLIEEGKFINVPSD